jgi:hypothetical protein
MADKPPSSPFDAPRDLGIDYALIATGVAAALAAMIYLLLV